MAKFIASVTTKETREMKLIEKEYETKAAFTRDLRSNGYAVRFITTAADFDRDCDRYYAQLERNAERARIRREVRKGRVQ